MKKNISEGEMNLKKNKLNQNSNLNKILADFRRQVKSLSYQESLELLDSLISQLQEEVVPLEDLQVHYLKSQTCLENCEKLLNEIEQSLTHFKAQEIEATNDD